MVRLSLTSFYFVTPAMPTRRPHATELLSAVHLFTNEVDALQAASPELGIPRDESSPSLLALSLAKCHRFA